MKRMSNEEFEEIRDKNKKEFKYLHNSKEMKTSTFILQTLALFLWFYSAIQAEIGLKVIIIWIIAFMIMKYSLSTISAFISLFAAICSFYATEYFFCGLYIIFALVWVLPGYTFHLNHVLLNKVGLDLRAIIFVKARDYEDIW